MKTMHHPFIIGKKIYLRGIEKEDLKGNYFQWANDSEVTYFMEMGDKPNSLEILEEEYDRSIRSNNEIAFLIIKKETNNIIGSTGLYSINRICRKAEFRIIIGEKKYWSKGYGTEVTELIIEYAFDKLNLNKIWLGGNAKNEGAIKSYKNAGFIEEGVLREEIYRNGTYYDAVRMSILRDEYYVKIKNKNA